MGKDATETSGDLLAKRADAADAEDTRGKCDEGRSVDGSLCNQQCVARQHLLEG